MATLTITHHDDPAIADHIRAMAQNVGATTVTHHNGVTVAAFDNADQATALAAPIAASALGLTVTALELTP